MDALLDKHNDRDRRQHSRNGGEPENDVEGMHIAVEAREHADNRQRRQRTGDRSGRVGRLVEAERATASRSRNRISEQSVMQGRAETSAPPPQSAHEERPWPCRNSP